MIERNIPLRMLIGEILIAAMLWLIRSDFVPEQIRDAAYKIIPEDWNQPIIIVGGAIALSLIWGSIRYAGVIYKREHGM